jgi:hypothetical protein
MFFTTIIAERPAEILTDRKMKSVCSDDIDNSSIVVSQFTVGKVVIPTHISSVNFDNCQGTILDLKESQIQTLDILNSRFDNVIIPSTLKHISFNADHTFVDFTDSSVKSVYWQGEDANNIKRCKIPYNIAINRRSEIMDKLQEDHPDSRDALTTLTHYQAEKLNDKVVEELKIMIYSVKVIRSPMLKETMNADQFDGAYYYSFLHPHRVGSFPVQELENELDSESLTIMLESRSRYYHGSEHLYIHQPSLQRVLICDAYVSFKGMVPKQTYLEWADEEVSKDDNKVFFDMDDLDDDSYAFIVDAMDKL